MEHDSLYDNDFYEWTLVNAALLREGRFAEADIDHIAEELEDMGRHQKHELTGRLKVLLAHLLKWKFQPEKRSPSWERTIVLQRDQIDDLLSEMPSLRSHLEKAFPGAYGKAVRFASIETGLPPDAFPEAPPFTISQALDPEFYPD